MPTRAALVALLLALALPAPAPAAVDWTPWADLETVEVLTQDEDGEPRETTIWIVVVDGDAYIRTGGSRWGRNVRRSPDIALRGEPGEVSVRARFVEDDAQRERIVQGFREKYGWTDWFISPIRGSRPNIMRLEPR